MLKELRRMAPNIHCNLFNIILIATKKDALKEPCRKTYSRDSRWMTKGLAPLLLGNILDLLFVEIALPWREGLEFYRHLLDTLEVILKINEFALLENILTADDLHLSFKQHSSSDRPMHQNQYEVPAAFDSQLLQALLVLSKSYGWLHCWTSPAVTGVILCLRAHIIFGSKACEFIPTLSTSRQVASAG